MPGIGIESAVFAASGFTHDPEPFQMLHGSGDGRESEIEMLARTGDGNEWLRLEHPMHAQCRASRFANGLQLLFIGSRQRHQRPRGFSGLGGGFGNAAEEKPKPSLPVACEPHGLEQFVIPLTMLFEIQAETEQRLPERTFGAKQEGLPIEPKPIFFDSRTWALMGDPSANGG